MALKPVMTLMTYTRRFAASVGALALGADEAGSAINAASTVLDDLAAAITERRPPSPFPPPGTVSPGDAPLPPLISARVVRLSRQLKPLHDAVAEMSVVPAALAD